MTILQKNIAVLPIFFAFAALPAIVFAQNGTFIDVGTHPQAKNQASALGKNLFGLQEWNGKLYSGYGDYGANTGPISITSFNPSTSSFSQEWVSSTDAIWIYRAIKDKLFAPAIDRKVTADFAVGEIGKPWIDYGSIGTTHAFDMASLDGNDLWVVGSSGINAIAWRSLDNGATWQNSLSIPPQPNGSFARFYFIGVYNGNVYVQGRDFNAPAHPNSKVFNGSTWSDGPAIITGNELGWNPIVFAGKMVYLTWQPHVLSDLKIFDGTTATYPLTSKVAAIYAYGDYLYVLGIDGTILRTNDLLTWEPFITNAPLNARGITVVDGYIYVGTQDSHLHKYSEPVSTLPPVYINAVDDSAYESGSDVASFTISRLGDTSDALTLTYDISGSATNGQDYELINGSVTLEAGENSKQILVSPLADSLSEANENIILTLRQNTSSYVLGTPNSAEVIVYSSPRVSILAQDATASEENQDTASYRITRDGPTDQPLNVSFSLSGQATKGNDFQINTSPVTILAGQSFVDVIVTPVDETVVEQPTETVILSIAANSSYTVGLPRTATITIADNDRSTVTVTAPDAQASEAGDQGIFEIVRSGGSANASLTINLVISGQATNGTDYTSLQKTLVIPAGQTSSLLELTPIDDTSPEQNETVTVGFANGLYNIGLPKNATVTISDNDRSTVTVTSSDTTASESEQDTGTILVSRSGGSINSALTVNISITGSATNGTDYGTIAKPVTIPAGESQVSILITPVDDDISEQNETVTITAGQGLYNLGSLKTATVTIADNDRSTVTLTSPDTNAAENGSDPGAIIVTRSVGSIASPLTVNLSISGSATKGTDYESIANTLVIPAGVSSTTVILTPIDDLLPEQNETASISIASGAYNLGTPKSANITIVDNDRSTLTLTAPDSQASETGTDQGSFEIVRSGGVLAAITVKVSISGSALNGTDYSLISTSIPMAEGETSVTVPVTPMSDAVTESNETVKLTLAAGTYTLGTPKSATVSIVGP